MNSSKNPTIRDLNDCGCCEGISAQTPLQVYNRPGLSALAYRVGTHAQFKQTLLARLSGANQAALQNLTTCNDDDFAIALLDAWAVVADVLTFYQERIANESYLRTATERLSVLEMARLIDYEIRPGVAASVDLAFTIEDASGAFGQALGVGTTAQIVPEPSPPIIIDIGAKVQSIPGPDEKAQIFETIEKIEARAEWNAIKPRMIQLQKLKKDMGSVILKGTATNLKQGDTLLIVDDSGHREPRTILSVAPDDKAKTTRVDFEEDAKLSPPNYVRPSLPWGDIGEDFPTQVSLDENAVKKIMSKKWRGEDLSALVKMQNWQLESLVANIEEQKSLQTDQGDTGVFALRQRAFVFGYNAVKEISFNGTVPKPQSQWSEWKIAQDEGGGKIYLDTVYEAIVPGSWAVILRQNSVVCAFNVLRTEIRSRSAYGLSSKTTVLTLPSGKTWWSPQIGNEITEIRATTVLAQSEQLTLGDVPIEDLVEGNSGITLDRVYLGLKIGQRIILTGERSDLKGVYASETKTLKDVVIEGGFTVLTLDSSLDYSYVRKTVTINANVASATHGETVQEVLGSGDASQPFQRFTLRQTPLTYVSSSTATGSQTTLEVRVNDIFWHEVATFYGHGPDERIYVTKTDDDDKTTIIFGDGKTGVRLPTGQENVKAKYRKGIGLSGLVKTDKLTQLMTRPLGLKGVTNPCAASGAEDRENLSKARSNAPLSVLTLGRIVSLQDYEDFARAFAGIDKALAIWAWNGEKRIVFVTVAGPKGEKVDDTLCGKLLTGMRKAGDPYVPLMVETYDPRLFRLSAAVQVKPDYMPEKVLLAVEEQLRKNFSFDARSLGQPVWLSEIIAIMQNVPGAAAINVNEFYRVDQSPTTSITGSTSNIREGSKKMFDYRDELRQIQLKEIPRKVVRVKSDSGSSNRSDAIGIFPDKSPVRLEAAAPRLGGNTVFAAELLTLDPRPIGLERMP